jgi:hypothetical protein
MRALTPAFPFAYRFRTLPYRPLQRLNPVNKPTGRTKKKAPRYRGAFKKF